MPGDSPADQSLKYRETMVRDQLIDRGVLDKRVLDAARKIPRELFMPGVPAELAYEDHPSPIGHGQTISQPYIVALMLERASLKPQDKVLEIGAGSGYQTALLAEICAAVYTVERIPKLAEEAMSRLRALGYSNVSLRIGDGTLGWPEEALYDAIIVSAAAPRVPQPLLDQLADGGRLVIPVGGQLDQELLVIERIGKTFRQTSAGGCVFVKLIGAEGWNDGATPE